MKHKLQSTIWKYNAFNFFENMAFFTAVLVPFYTKWGGISITQIQILQSWFMFWGFILEIPTGVIADKIGRKFSIGIGALIFGLGVFIYGLIPDFKIFLLGEFLSATGIAFVSGAGQALLYDELKTQNRETESKKFLGQADAAKYAGILASGLIGGIIAAKFGLNAPMYLTAIPLIIAAIIAFSIKESRINIMEPIRRQLFLEKARIGFDFLKNNPRFRGLVIDALAVASSAYFIVWFYQLLLTKINIPIIYFGLANATLMMAEIIVSTNFHRLEKIFGTEKYLKLTAISTSITFILAALFPNIVTIILFLIIGGGFGLTRLTFLIGHLNQFIPTDNRATILSTISLFKKFILVILNPIVGFMADKSLPISLFSLGLISLLPLIYNKKYGTKV